MPRVLLILCHTLYCCHEWFDNAHVPNYYYFVAYSDSCHRGTKREWGQLWKESIWQQSARMFPSENGKQAGKCVAKVGKQIFLSKETWDENKTLHFIQLDFDIILAVTIDYLSRILKPEYFSTYLRHCVLFD